MRSQYAQTASMGEGDITTTAAKHNTGIFESLTNEDVDSRGLGWFIYDNLKRNNDIVFQVNADTGEKSIYSNVLQKSIRTAIHMQRHGLKSGDIISICSDSHLDCVIPIFAAFFIGVKIAPMDPMLSVNETAHLLKLVEPKMVFCCRDGEKLLIQTMEETNVKKVDIVAFDEKTNNIPFSDCLKRTENENEFEPEHVKDVRDTACILFTSGTTGMPKGICLSHFGLMYQTKTQPIPFKILSFTRVYWISNMILVLTLLRNKSCGIIGNFNPKTIFKILHDHKVDMLFLSPLHSYRITQYPEYNIYDIYNLKVLFVAGGIVGRNQIMKIRECFPHSLVLSAYGMTETTAAGLMFDPPRDFNMILDKPTSCGKPCPGIQYKIVDLETEEILGPNQPGELRMRAISVMNGYYNNPKDTAAIFDSDGYIKTGDIMYYDEDDCYFAVERAKDMMKYQGWMIMPAELEHIIYEHPCVQDNIVISKPHEVDGDRPMAIVVLKPQSKCTEQEILEFVHSKIDVDRKGLHGGVKFVDKIPVTPSGKYRRRDLRVLVKEGKL